MERMENKQIVAPYRAVPTRGERERVAKIFYAATIVTGAFWIIAMTIFTYN